MTETILSWVRTYPGFTQVQYDGVEPSPGCAGLYGKGQAVAGVSRDILGRERRRVRMGWLLTVFTVGPSAVLEDFAQWALSTAPILGEQQTVRCEKAALAAQNGSDLCRYTMELSMEFTL